MNKEHQTPISGLIFKELIKRGYSLEGNTRIWNIADSKLWYLKPKQAQAYLDLLDSEEYLSAFGPKEARLIQKHASDVISRVPENPVNIVDLGCGDGRKAVIFLEKLIEKKQKVRYCPIDISGYMVGKAIEKISKMDVDEVIESNWNISDFENLENITTLLNQGIYKNNIFLLLGNTLGNFEFHDLLYQIRNSMRTGDHLIIGNGLNNGKVEEDVIRFCKKNKQNNEFLIQIPLQLGLSREDIKFGVRFVNSRVEFYYELQNSRKISFNERKVFFNKGDQIVVAVSYHYTKEDFVSFLEIYFENVKLFTLENKSYTLAMCQK